MTSAPLVLYRAITAALEPGAGLLLRRRERRGKEDGSRLGERIGRAALARPAGALAWVHGASVGESLAVLPFVSGLTDRGFAVLVTTGTVTSSRLLPARLPPGAFHQFAPLDLPRATGRFYDHWRPDLICLTESELWPNLLAEAGRRRIPTILVNARMSGRSFGRWRRATSLIRPLLDPFRLILAQSELDAERWRAFAKTEVRSVGNLKFDAEPPPADPAELDRLRAAIAGRPVWVAASTQAVEDLHCVAVHKEVTAVVPGLLTIIVPRKTDRGPAIETEAARLGVRSGRRSHGNQIDGSTELYIADTMGEVGLFYRASPLVFVGKSLGCEGGGQNPIEAAKLGCAVLHGPLVANFAAVYADLDASGGARSVQDAAGLAAVLADLLRRPQATHEAGEAARRAVERLGGATALTLAAIEPFCGAILGGGRR
jgi:3-deoxy-D-manno-octulosonic-acid transferase